MSAKLINQKLSNYALKTEIPEPVDLSNYALKSEIPTLPTDHVTTAQLTTKLEDYITKSALTDDYYNADEINDTFASKNELETVDNKFADYALKSEIPETVDLSDYRKYNDLSVNITEKQMVELPVEHKEYPEESLTGERNTTAFVEFHEGAHLVGYDKMNRENTFDIIYKTESTRLLHNETVHVMTFKAAFTIYLYWGETSGAIYDYGGTYPIAITKAEYEDVIEYSDDELALKSNLNEYRKYDDLAVNITVDLPIEHKSVPYGEYDFLGETAYLEFHEGAQLEGYALVPNAETKEYVQQEFNITFHTNYTYANGEHEYYIKISEEVESFRWNAKTNAFTASGDIWMAVHLNSAKLITEDKLVLKSSLTSTLNNYALKSENDELNAKIASIESDLSEYAKLTNLDEYRKYNDFAVNINVDLPIEHKTVPNGMYDFLCETAYVEFHEGTQLEGYVLIWNQEIEEYVFHKELNITFHTDRIYDDGEHTCNTTISEDFDCFCWNEKTNVFYAGGGYVGMAVHLNSAKLVTEDKLVLTTELALAIEQVKSEYDAKIKSLEERIAALEAK